MSQNIINQLSKGGVILLFFIFVLAAMAGFIDKVFIVPATFMVLLMIGLRYGWKMSR